MFAKTATVSLALVAAAAPAMSAPLPVDARAIPAGVGSAISSLGKGILSGGAVAGLLGLLGAGDDSTPAA